jgi:murein DD-endopeptidase MepM/ murein hydrolase activator NlpD
VIGILGKAVRGGVRAAFRACSLRNVVALATGAALALVPFIADPALDSTVVQLPYSPRYPHQGYGYSLALTPLRTNAAARGWFAAADRALLEPEQATLPLAASGELAGSAATGYAFSVASGRRLRIDARRGTRDAGELFVDLFSVHDGRYERIAGALPRGALEPIALDVVEAGDYVLRVQPALAAAGSYTLRVAAEPLLGFPVAGVDERAIWSGFGADRDGGRRAHRGVDIFAPRGTPVFAAVDGWVLRVETTRVGGNVVWQQPLFGNMRLYYAHLDEQWVEIGDFVRRGESLGTVGNTGNAATTPPHLHFGVYVRQPGQRGGARDPADFLR